MSIRRAGVSSLLTLVMLAGCSRQPGVQESVAGSGASRQLPFERASKTEGISPTGSFSSSELPPGTSLPVQLRSNLSSATAQAGDAFQAVLDEAVKVDDQVLLPRGTWIAGKILTAKASSGPDDPGYLRLTLTSISIANRSIAIQTSSIFAKAESRIAAAPVMKGGLVPAAASARTTSRLKNVDFAEEHRLTFRLTQTLTLP